jgi:hypothetical protein
VTCFWLLLDAAGGAAGRSGEFADREGAEAWLSERWADLLDAGVEAVELREEADVRYRMSLREAGPDA